MLFDMDDDTGEGGCHPELGDAGTGGVISDNVANNVGGNFGLDTIHKGNNVLSEDGRRSKANNVLSEGGTDTVVKFGKSEFADSDLKKPTCPFNNLSEVGIKGKIDDVKADFESDNMSSKAGVSNESNFIKGTVDEIKFEIESDNVSSKVDSSNEINITKGTVDEIKFEIESDNVSSKVDSSNEINIFKGTVDEIKFEIESDNVSSKAGGFNESNITKGTVDEIKSEIESDNVSSKVDSSNEINITKGTVDEIKAEIEFGDLSTGKSNGVNFKSKSTVPTIDSGVESLIAKFDSVNDGNSSPDLNSHLSKSSDKLGTGKLTIESDSSLKSNFESDLTSKSKFGSNPNITSSVASKCDLGINLNPESKNVSPSGPSENPVISKGFRLTDDKSDPVSTHNPIVSTGFVIIDNKSDTNLSNLNSTPVVSTGFAIIDNLSPSSNSISNSNFNPITTNGLAIPKISTSNEQSSNRRNSRSNSNSDNFNSFNFNSNRRGSISSNHRVSFSNSTTDFISIPIPPKFRRSLIASSYGIDIKKSYVNSSIKTNYKPKLSDFEQIKVLGQGSYGKVLLVREISTGKLFAQKQLKKATFIINENTNEINELNYKRTLNEKNILESVNHPNIVKLYYAFQDNNKVYLILEYLQGGELFHHLAQERFISEKNSSYYIAQIILALRYLHLNLKVIYRDLKPENCLLNSKGNLVLTDFGLSKELSTNDKKNHSITGTAQYMAPEVIKGEPYDYTVDWWSLGCVAYDLLVGQPPFTGSNNKKIMDKIINSSKKTLKFPFYLSNDAKDILRKLLQVDPSKRFNIDEDFDKLKKHAFFRHVDWKELEHIDESENLPPILPIITDPILAENFDTDFTDMQFTPQNQSNYLEKDIFHVMGFSYTNESYLNSGIHEGK